MPGYFGPMDPSNNETFTFLNNLFKEILQVFQDRYIHLGGDEVPLDCWASNREVRRLLSHLTRDNYTGGRNSMRKVWNYFTRRLTSDITKMSINRTRGVRMVMWEETLKNELDVPKDTIIQIWFSKQEAVERAVQKGHKVIFSTCWYLDWIKYGVQWPQYYLCDPNPNKLGFESIEQGILGGEAALWSEYITNENAISTLW